MAGHRSRAPATGQIGTRARYPTPADDDGGPREPEHSRGPPSGAGVGTGHIGTGQTVHVCMIRAPSRRAVSWASRTSSGLIGFTPSIMSISRMPYSAAAEKRQA
ncbi:hypothetical protein C8E95_2619 [Pseudonocardia autotrophica]|uniref:Uncharacterized protein n=1 Tax=Pseudonocardia autotrophica TaxID=2074 RepID=A0A1Y2N8U0_PSEAH|nr:hypothetical protein BG845_00430 [Pseudonocardia autotrophica]TDN73519.1 hypothetical protein C8E95_2619 [Pseudonocardia autotrophica]